MSRVISLFVLILLVMTVSIGCSSTPEKSEEELREEIRAELEAEQATEQNASKVDMQDKDALYEFVNQEILDITRENFDTLEVHYFDITGNGTDEAVLSSSYLEAWYEKVEIISGDSGDYKRISSDIGLGKYGTKFDFQDGFLVVESSTGGTGEQMTYLELYKYNNSGMVNVLPGLDISHTVAFPNADFEETGKIDGPLTNFVYTLTKHDNSTGKETTEMKKQYTYNANTMSFDVTPTQGQTVNDNQGSSSQSEGKLREVYEVNKEYKYDLNQDESLDTFSVVKSTDDPQQYEIYLLVNNQRYDFIGLEPDLVYYKYKITKHPEESAYVFVLSAACPPSGPDEIYFYLYSTNYSVENLGFITPDMDIESLDIKNLTYSDVKIGNKTFTLK